MGAWTISVFGISRSPASASWLLRIVQDEAAASAVLGLVHLTQFHRLQRAFVGEEADMHTASCLALPRWRWVRIR